jgi:Holliday junction resolvase RusA-like endonuclease
MNFTRRIHVCLPLKGESANALYQHFTTSDHVNKNSAVDRYQRLIAANLPEDKIEPPLLGDKTRIRLELAFGFRTAHPRDVDNLLKPLIDAIKSKIFGDDRYVFEITVRKFERVPQGYDFIDIVAEMLEENYDQRVAQYAATVTDLIEPERKTKKKPATTTTTTKSSKKSKRTEPEKEEEKEDQEEVTAPLPPTKRPRKKTTTNASSCRATDVATVVIETPESLSAVLDPSAADQKKRRRQTRAKRMPTIDVA